MSNRHPIKLPYTLQSELINFRYWNCIGPDGIRDHKTKILDPRVTGIGTISPEGTGDLDYMLRAAKVSKCTINGHHHQSCIITTTTFMSPL